MIIFVMLSKCRKLLAGLEIARPMNLVHAKEGLTKIVAEHTLELILDDGPWMVLIEKA